MARLVLLETLNFSNFSGKCCKFYHFYFIGINCFVTSPGPQIKFICDLPAKLHLKKPYADPAANPIDFFAVSPVKKLSDLCSLEIMVPKSTSQGLR